VAKVTGPFCFLIRPNCLLPEANLSDRYERRKFDEGDRWAGQPNIVTGENSCGSWQQVPQLKRPAMHI
jgi:hypothetical protein